MHEGASGYIVRRRGMATDTPLAVGQKLTVVSVICGEKQVINPDASTMIRSKIPLFAKAPGWGVRDRRDLEPKRLTPPTVTATAREGGRTVTVKEAIAGG